MAGNGLVRPHSRKMVAGVCAGLADRYGMSVKRVRWAFVVLGLFGPGEVIYLALWIVAPAAP